MPEKMLFEGATAKSESMLGRLRSGLAVVFEPSSGVPGDVPADSPVHFDTIREQSVLQGLRNELGYAVAELRRDPRGFVAAVMSPDINDPDNQRTRRAAFALTLAVPALAAAAFVLGLGFSAFMDVWEWFAFFPHTEAALILQMSRGFPFDLAHAVGNVIIALAVGSELRRVLERYERRTRFEIVILPAR